MFLGLHSWAARESELVDDRFMRDALTALDGSASAVEVGGRLGRNLFLLNRHAGHRLGNGVQHGFQEAGDRRQLRRRQALNRLMGVFFGSVGRA